MRSLLVLCGLLFLLSAGAEEPTVYKKVRPDGTVEFSDAPTVGAEPVEVTPIQTYTPPPIPRSQPPAQAPAAPEPVAYERLQITEPAQDSTVFFDANGMPVSVAVTPGLQPGHVVSLFLDGRQVARGTEGRFILSEVYRGTHTLTAQVEASGVVLRRSEPVTFHFIQHAKRR